MTYEIIVRTGDPTPFFQMRKMGIEFTNLTHELSGDDRVAGLDGLLTAEFATQADLDLAKSILPFLI